MLLVTFIQLLITRIVYVIFGKSYAFNLWRGKGQRELLLLVPFALGLANANGLKLGFYHKTCQSIEAIVKETIADFFSRFSTLLASFDQNAFS
ncbi:hypothetical protein LOK49_LG04G01959 [Camellia lanceoleosa]|uniref:Uncharacterized protein n=1 Tax=Camellia lanceoleosa TaxID=1840588 RepID=A0ACC0HVJ3_9ERIC|nr:hypothetical protein LOK49_LG04G01959 [Camellia lanceoleosa]